MGNLQPDIDQKDNYLRKPGINLEDQNWNNKVALPLIDENLTKIAEWDTQSNRNMSPLHKMRDRAKDILAQKVIAE